MIEATDLHLSEEKLRRVGAALVQTLTRPVYSWEHRDGVYLLQDWRDATSGSFGAVVFRTTDIRAAQAELIRLSELALAKLALKTIMDEGLL